MKVTAYRFMHLGRFVGHNGAVCALEMKGSILATGSRDRLIKVCIYDTFCYQLLKIYVVIAL